jgi:hypothetical protein
MDVQGGCELTNCPARGWGFPQGGNDITAVSEGGSTVGTAS